MPQSRKESPFYHSVQNDLIQYMTRELGGRATGALHARLEESELKPSEDVQPFLTTSPAALSYSAQVWGV